MADRISKKFIFIPQDEIKYHVHGQGVHGETVTASELHLYAPSERSRDIAPLIKQMFTQALMSGRDMASQQNLDEQKRDANPNEEVKMDGEVVITLLYMSKVVDIIKMCDLFRKLILSPNICFLDDKQPITSLLLENLSMEEFDRLMGEYLANFMLPSALTQKKN